MRVLVVFSTLLLMTAAMACGTAATPASTEITVVPTPTVTAIPTTTPAMVATVEPPAEEAAPPTPDPSPTPHDDPASATSTPEPVVVETPAITPTEIPTAIPPQPPPELLDKLWPLWVESVSVVPAGDGFSLRVVTTLPSYCYRVTGHDLEVEEDKLMVAVTFVNDAETQAIACAQALKENVKDIPLPEDLQRGCSYEVAVNGHVVATVTVPEE